MTDRERNFLVDGALCLKDGNSKWADRRIPESMRRLLPSLVLAGLRAVKSRIVTRHFPRNAKFEQSLEDALAAASMSIIVPIHDAPGMVRRCLGSLEKWADQAEVILVDDASRLAETRRIMARFANRNNWQVICNADSKGHSEACRSGAASSTRPYLCLLNSDTVVTPWCWRRVKEAFEANLSVGVAGPSTSNSGTDQTLPTAFRFRWHWNDNQICYFSSRLLAEFVGEPLADVPWASGFALFVRRSLWDALGGFDFNLPDYGNEVEFCDRARRCGHRVVWVRTSYIHHFGQQSYQSAIGKQGIMSQVRAAEKYTGIDPSARY